MLPIERLELVKDKKTLQIKSKKVSKWSGERIGMKLIKFISSNEIQCFGLAAPQIGVHKRVFVMFDGINFAIFVNPKVLEIGPILEEATEGCLSLPGETYRIQRPTSIIVKDAVRTAPLELNGITARVWLHELDHLDGKLISDIGIKVVETNVVREL